MSEQISEFRLEVAIGDGMNALRRFGWQMAIISLVNGAGQIALMQLQQQRAFLGADSDLFTLGVWVASRAGAVLAVAAICLLTIEGARGQPLRQGQAARRIASCLLGLAVVEAVFTLPGVVLSRVFAAVPGASGVTTVAIMIFQTVLLLTLGLVVPALIDRGPPLSVAVERAVALVKGRRFALFLMSLAPSFAAGVIGGAGRHMIGDSEALAALALSLGTALISNLTLVAIAAVYLESEAANGESSTRLAETFD
jgi:hypothetical protein